MTVVFDMLHDPSSKCLAGVVDGFEVLAHRGSREVGVCASTIPIALLWFSVQRNDDVVVLGNSGEQPARNMQMIAACQGVRRSDLKLPLSWHHFGVGA